MTVCPNGNLLTIMAIHCNGTSSRVNSKAQIQTDEVKSTYLKTIVAGKTKIAIAEFAYCCLMYEDEPRPSKRELGQPQGVIISHLDTLSKFFCFKMHKSDKIINYSAVISSFVEVL